jgi:hypothetical protein
MKSYLILLTVVIGLCACSSPNQKEIGEVDELLLLVDSLEKSLLSIDTSRVLATGRQMDTDFKEYFQFTDTLTREEVFRVENIFGSKKRFLRIKKNYGALTQELSHSKKQLNNLKVDLKNGLVKKEQYRGYYDSEKNAYNGILHKISKSVINFEEAISKYELERPELLEFIEKRKQRQ